MPGSEEEITWTYTQQQEDTSNATDFNEVMNDLVPAAKCQYICGFQCPILEKDPEAASLDSCHNNIHTYKAIKHPEDSNLSLSH